MTAQIFRRALAASILFVTIAFLFTACNDDHTLVGMPDGLTGTVRIPIDDNLIGRGAFLLDDGGLVMYGEKGSGETSAWLQLCDDNGRVEAFEEMDGRLLSLKPLADGSFAGQLRRFGQVGGSANNLAWFDRRGELTRMRQLPSDFRDFYPLANGTLLQFINIPGERGGWVRYTTADGDSLSQWAIGLAGLSMLFPMALPDGRLLALSGYWDNEIDQLAVRILPDAGRQILYQPEWLQHRLPSTMALRGHGVGMWAATIRAEWWRTYKEGESYHLHRLRADFTSQRHTVVGSPDRWLSPHDIVSLSDGGCVVLSLDIFRPGEPDEAVAVTLQRFDADLNELWRRSYGDVLPATDRPTPLDLRANTLGYTILAQDIDPILGPSDLILIHTDEQGRVE